MSAALAERPHQSLQDMTLDDLLIRWHQWDPGMVGRGWNDRSLVAGDYRSSRQYDDVNGALDDDVEATVMRQVDFEISQLSADHRIVIAVQARALTLGTTVFTNPRLPTDPVRREALLQEARGRLMQRLLAAGVM